MHFASLTFATVIGSALVVAALWFTTDSETHHNVQADHTHNHQPSHLSDVWVAIAPGFR